MRRDRASVRRTGSVAIPPPPACSGENTAAALLLAFTVIAIVWANSSWAESYSEFWSTEAGLRFGDLHAQLSVKHLVNEGGFCIGSRTTPRTRI